MLGVIAGLSLFVTTAGLTQGQHPGATASPNRLHEPWRVPIHTAAASAAPTAGAPARLAFGESFKATRARGQPAGASARHAHAEHQLGLERHEQGSCAGCQRG
jgi:hypothetical protein